MLDLSTWHIQLLYCMTVKQTGQLVFIMLIALMLNELEMLILPVIRECCFSPRKTKPVACLNLLWV